MNPREWFGQWNTAHTTQQRQTRRWVRKKDDPKHNHDNFEMCLMTDKIELNGQWKENLIVNGQKLDFSMMALPFVISHGVCLAASRCWEKDMRQNPI